MYDGTSSRWVLVGDAPMNTPGAYWWTFANDGGPADGIITTTDATPVFRTWGQLNSNVGSINFQCWFTGVSSDGSQCLFRMQQGGHGSNAVGENGLFPFAAVSNSGYDELGTGMAPWNNLVTNPAGWGGGANYAPGGGIIQTAFNGAAGRNVDWSCLILAFPFNGATIVL